MGSGFEAKVGIEFWDWVEVGFKMRTGVGF